MPATTLIVTSGDISDADGFIALARYAQTGADCMFVMNFPAYLHMHERVKSPVSEVQSPGLGYRYSARDVLSVEADAWNCADVTRYNDYVRRHRDAYAEDDEAMKRMLSDLAASMVRRVWTDARAAGTLYYCVGGVNDVCPFSLEKIKNELKVYAPLLPDEAFLPPCGAEEEAVFECAADAAPARLGCVHDFRFDAYSRIVMDMNGSAAFMKGAGWRSAMASPTFRVEALYVMGGVRTDEALKTSPAIPGLLNRFAGSTMNQLYSPGGTKLLLEACVAKKAPVYVVTNNAVMPVVSDPEAGPDAKVEGMLTFLAANGYTDCPCLDEIVRLFYPTNAPKPFDCYVAEAVVHHLQVGRKPPSEVMVLSYNSRYGVTLLSTVNSASAGAVKRQYVTFLNQKPKVASEAMRQADGEAVMAMTFDYSRPVGMLTRFVLDPSTKRLTFAGCS